jgi:hypothetical protein
MLTATPSFCTAPATNTHFLQISAAGPVCCCYTYACCRCWPQATNPAEHPLWHLAQRLGASCSMSFEQGVTTHVVVAPDKNDIGGVPLTDKVRFKLQLCLWWSLQFCELVCSLVVPLAVANKQTACWQLGCMSAEMHLGKLLCRSLHG